MSTAKEKLTRLNQAQPDDSSREEILRELAFHIMIERGIADLDAKRVISNDEMARRIRSWQTTGSKPTLSDKRRNTAEPERCTVTPFSSAWLIPDRSFFKPMTDGTTDSEKKLSHPGSAR